jgi:hypothetical protein
MTLLASILSAVVGASIGFVGGWLSDRRNERQEQARWRREQRTTAYDAALRHLLHAANWRSKTVVKTGTPISEAPERGQWFHEVQQAQFWLRTLGSHCGTTQYDRLHRATDELDDVIASMSSIGASEILIGSPGATALFRRIAATVAECERSDIGNDPTDNRRGKPTASTPTQKDD